MCLNAEVQDMCSAGCEQVGTAPTDGDNSPRHGQTDQHGFTALFTGKSRGRAFDGMNGIAANMLLHLTSSVRFEGALNVDLNEITTNLVPFPRLHFLLASLSPLAAPKDMGRVMGAPRAVDQVLCI